MPDNLCNTHRSRGTRGNNLSVFLVMFLLVLTSVTNGSAADKVGSNKQLLSFGKGQTIIDLQNVIWEPLPSPIEGEVKTCNREVAHTGSPSDYSTDVLSGIDEYVDRRHSAPA